MRFVHVLGFLLVFFAYTQTVSAAALYLDPNQSELFRGDSVEVSVRLDVDEAAGECVNAVDVVLNYTSNVVPVDVSIGDSILSMWVERPTIDQENNTVTFAGGIPNGYCGRVIGDPRLTNQLATVVFRSPGFSIASSDESNEANITFGEATTAYLNDGFGTSLAPETYNARIALNKNAGSEIKDPWGDTVDADDQPPQEFSIFLNKDRRAFSQKYFISFNTTDKETGIDQFQVMEQPLDEFGTFIWGRADAPWITARSPYVLDDQSLNSVIRVRAIDKAGNEYIATLLPDESLRGMSHAEFMTYVMFGIIGLIVFGCLGVIVAYFLRRKKQKDTDEFDDDEYDDEPLEDNDSDDEYEE